MSNLPTPDASIDAVATAIDILLRQLPERPYRTMVLNGIRSTYCEYCGRELEQVQEAGKPTYNKFCGCPTARHARTVQRNQLALSKLAHDRGLDVTDQGDVPEAFIQA